MSTLSRRAHALGPADRPALFSLSAGLDRLPDVGRLLLAAGVAALGVQCLILARPVPGLEPLPGWLPGAGSWALATGALLLASGIGLAARRFARPAAQVLAGIFTLWLAALHAPQLIASPTSGGAWTVALETLALACAAWTLGVVTGRFTPSPDVPPGTPAGWPARVNCIGFGASLIGFGILHLIYWDYVSSVIPAWIPGHLFWTYATAAAFFAAGTALLLGIQTRRAATWVGIMFLLWFALLHVPRVAAKPSSPAEWTSMLIALSMGGGGWIIARAQEENGSTRPSTPRLLHPPPAPRTSSGRCSDTTPNAAGVARVHESNARNPMGEPITA